MKIIQCDCGEFQAEILNLPKSSLGRVVCYCSDCQSFLEQLGREELLDDFGGTEIVPVYPSDFRFLKGHESLRCNRLSAKGLNRWSAKCCNAPIANIKAGFWVGIFHNAYTQNDPNFLREFGPVRSRIMGKNAKPNPPFRISKTLGLKDTLVVLPFLLKGKLKGKLKGAPFFEKDGVTPIVKPELF